MAFLGCHKLATLTLLLTLLSGGPAPTSVGVLSVLVFDGCHLAVQPCTGLGVCPPLKPASAAHQTSVTVKRQKRGTQRGTALVFLNQEQSMWASGECVMCPFCLANVDFIFRVLGLRARSKSGIPWKERKAIGVWDGLRSLVPGAPAWLPRWPRTAGGRRQP